MGHTASKINPREDEARERDMGDDRCGAWGSVEQSKLAEIV
jgi:hypothetical protein